MNLRKYAQGKPCMVRLPGCDGGGETTVLAHYRCSSTGMGKKENDLIGAWACCHCHDLVDGRKPNKLTPRCFVKDMFLEGIIRTQQQLIREFNLKIEVKK
jgi:hypothetical protein